MPEFPDGWIEIGTFQGQPFYLQPFDPDPPAPPQPTINLAQINAHLTEIITRRNNVPDYDPTTDEIMRLLNTLTDPIDTPSQPTEIQQEEPPMHTLLDLDGNKLMTFETTPVLVHNHAFIKADFRNLDLTNASFEDCSFEDCDFSDATLSYASFRRTTHTDSVFHGARMNGANFNRATVGSSDFHGAFLNNARFECADLEGADFSTVASMTSAYFYDASYFHAASWPSTNWSSPNRYWYQTVYGIERCSDCESICGYTAGVNTEDEGWICEDCGGYDECYDCGEYYRDLNYHNSDYHDSCSCGCCDYDEDCDSGSGGGGNIRNYSYKPFWQNHGISQVKFGFELELSGPRSASQLVLDSDPAESKLLCKDDSSIPGGGFEIVSHPMDLDWFNANFDHALLPKLKDAGMRTSNECGLHVHVSRKAFSTNFHRLSWLNLIYMNADPLTKLARRESRNWAQFNKPNKGELPAKAKEHGWQWVRYQAVNCQNEHTFEMRFFRSTTNRIKLRAALEFADASVEYTRTVRSRDVLKGGALTWDHFYQWIIVKGDRYRHLQQQMEELTSDYLQSGGTNTSLNGGF